MLSHRAIWTVAIGAALLAAAVVFVRDNAAHSPDAGSRLALAVRLLENDPALFDHETQAAVRAAAVDVDAGAERTAEGYLVLAAQYVRENDLRAAEAMYNRAITLKPDWAQPYVALGMLLGRSEVARPEEALRPLQKAVQFAPGWYHAHDALAQALRDLKRFDEAKAAARKALDLRPDDVAVENNYANLLMEMGDRKSAEPYYLRAIALGPDHPKPYYNLACLYSLTGRKDDALKYLTKAIERAPALRVQAAKDDDLAALRNDPGFRQLVNAKP